MQIAYARFREEQLAEMPVVYLMIKGKMGRPKKISPNSETARLFLDLYLDPLQSVDQILAATGIGLSTYYNWEKELNLPQIKVGFGCSSGHLPINRALKSLTDSEEKLELNLLRHISRFSNIRMKIVPIHNINGFSAITPVLNQELDCSIASISQTSERRQNLNFSVNYLRDTRPFGYIYRSKKYFHLFNSSKAKPQLGVVQKSVHEEHAKNCLQNEYEIKSYRAYNFLLAALAEGRIPFVLVHPNWLNKIPEYAVSLEVWSSRILYKSETGIVFNSKNDLHRESFNLAIEKILDQRMDLIVPARSRFQMED